MTLMETVRRNMVTFVKNEEQADFRIRIPESLKERWDETCARKKISSQDAGAALMGFLLDLPDAIQSAVLGQIDHDSSQAAAKWVIQRMAEATPVRRGKVSITSNGVTTAIR